jgi:hypothetical protein
MSSKRQLSPTPIFTAHSLASSFNSLPQQIQYTDNVGLEVDVTAASALNGVFAVQVSASYAQDAEGNVINAGTWTTVTTSAGSPIQATVTSTGSVYFDLNQLSAPWVRLAYTASAGTGTANGIATAKSV